MKGFTISGIMKEPYLIPLHLCSIFATSLFCATAIRNTILHPESDPYRKKDGKFQWEEYRCKRYKLWDSGRVNEEEYFVSQAPRYEEEVRIEDE